MSVREIADTCWLYAHRCLVLHHKLDLESNSKDEVRIALPQEKSAQALPSLVEILGLGSLKTRKPNKFPKDLTKHLDIAMKQVIMKIDPQLNDDLLRGSFGAFYSYFISDAFQKTIKDNRRVEDLILMFYSKSISEMQKRLPADEVAKTATVHVSRFLNLLCRVILSHKSLSNPDLVERLRQYEDKLRQSSGYIVEHSADTPRKDVASRPVSYQSSSYIDHLNCSFGVNKIRSTDALRDQWASCTRELALQDLEKLMETLHNEDASSKASNFASMAEYDLWRSEQENELQFMRSQMTRSTHSSKRNSQNVADSGTAIAQENILSTGLGRVSLDGRHKIDVEAPVVSTQPLWYSPLERDKNYEELCRSLFWRDRSVMQHDQREIFSVESQEILRICAVWWRVTPGKQQIAVVDLITEAYYESKIDLDVVEAGLNWLQEKKNSSPRVWNLIELDQYGKIRNRLADFLLRDQYSNLETAFEDERVDLSPSYVVQNYLLEGSLSAVGSKGIRQLVIEIKQGLSHTAKCLYAKMRNDYLNISHLELIQLTDLVNAISKKTAHLRKRYKQAILEEIDLWQIYGLASMHEFTLEFEKLYSDCQASAADNRPGPVVADALELYTELHHLLDMLRPFDRSSLLKLDEERIFRPVVSEWLQQAHASLQSLVSAAIAKDSFENVEDDGTEEARSLSVLLLFRSFNQHLRYLQDLEWPHEYWKAKFETLLCKAFGEALRDYCVKLENLFAEETTDKAIEDPAVSAGLQQRLLARAMDTISKKEVLAPFHVKSEACVKVNNIEWAKLQLDKLEHGMDAGKLTSIIEKYEGIKSSWQAGERTLFNIKILSAQEFVLPGTKDVAAPYVVISDEAGRRIGKTTAAIEEYEPRWNYSFEVSTTHPCWLTATLWGQDATGQHDICGRSFFRLDPRYFQDLEQKDFSFSLDTQGTLQVRLSMERETNVSTFYFSRAFRVLQRAEVEMTRTLAKKMQPFMQQVLSRQTLKSLVSQPLSLDSTIDSAYSFLNKAGLGGQRSSRHRGEQLTLRDTEAAIEPLLQYLDNNLRVLNLSLSKSAFALILGTLWALVIQILQDLMLSPLTKKFKARRRLTEAEIEVIYKWLALLKDTFGGDGGGLSEEELQTPEYNDLLSIRFFYFDDPVVLINELKKQRTGDPALSQQKTLSVTKPRLAYNLGTLKQRKAEKVALRRKTNHNENILLRVSVHVLLTKC